MKKRIRRGDPQRRHYWEEMVRRCRAGGQSVRAFCRAEGVRESAFYFWRRELTRRSQLGAGHGLQPQTSAFRSSKRVPPQPGPAPSFLPVHLAERSVAETVQCVEILLGQGRTVRVPAGFNRQALADVLAVLEVRPC